MAGALEGIYDEERSLLAERASAKTRHYGNARGSIYEEQFSLAAEDAAVMTFEYGKTRRSMRIEHSNLRSLLAAMLFCLILFFGMLGAHFALRQKFTWPVYIDCIPVFVLSCLIYIAAADYAATRVSDNAQLGKVAITLAGFLGAFALLLLSSLICMKLSGVIDWQWTQVVFPVWISLAFAQVFFCFMIPGFLRNHSLKLFVAAYFGIWMIALAVLLTTLTLDGALPGVHLWLPHWRWHTNLDNFGHADSRAVAHAGRRHKLLSRHALAGEDLWH